MVEEHGVMPRVTKLFCAAREKSIFPVNIYELKNQHFLIIP